MYVCLYFALCKYFHTESREGETARLRDLLVDSGTIQYFFPHFWVLLYSHKALHGVPYWYHHAYLIASWNGPQSTYIPKLPQCLYSRLTWDPPSLSRKRVCPRNQRGGHTCLWVRVWGAQFGRLEKKPSTLPTLWSTGNIGTYQISYLSLESGSAAKFIVPDWVDKVDSGIEPM